jgi:hypothetical protein
MAEQSFLSQARDWLLGIPEWLWVVTVRWSSLIGGGIVGIPVYLWDRFHDPSHQVSLKLLYGILAGAFVASGYDAWHKERQARRLSLPSTPLPDIHGRVVRFEPIDWSDIRTRDHLALEPDLHTSGSLHWFIAQIELDDPGASIRVGGWQFYADDATGM